MLIASSQCWLYHGFLDLQTRCPDEDKGVKEHLRLLLRPLRKGLNTMPYPCIG